ncbi:hypothetical protein G7085_04175 [Tessaracoccus sp. HDW20]|uniref:hypothetical protein n=1 Tax=Tessaracoccus coleopterorum TaxID=2714950 RepID=UPI0018D47EF1|nr:hypothetical protein [Tessaracoccus coleopterorum]NHB84108.1 hypothetical protein [Tessaracoccus coleopterorum]
MPTASEWARAVSNAIRTSAANAESSEESSWPCCLVSQRIRAVVSALAFGSTWNWPTPSTR